MAAHQTPPDDEQHMRRAVALADRARTTVSPRPWVGCVLVTPDGRTFEGRTEGRRGPHAEAAALRAAGPAARGATAYVTLEPCSHHGRTPPCADALVDAGVARVVVALTDPDPQVAGAGLARLRAAGVAVELGCGHEAVAEQLWPYLVHRRTGRPAVVLKLAASLDGRTAAPDGTSQWITGPEARADAHRLRAESDAIVVGAGTVRADDPALTVRLDDLTGQPDFRQPRRIVLGSAPPGARARPLEEHHGTLDDLLESLGAEGVLQVMVEGGATVARAVHQAGIVDRYVLYLAPVLFGGDDALGLFRGPGAPTLAEAWRGRIAAVRPLGADLRVDIVPATAESASAPRE